MDQSTDAAAAHGEIRGTGDETGYESLVTRYAPLVYARCRRALGTADADDATQAVFLVLARKRAQASASPAMAAWLLTVADNVIRNARRDLARRRRAEADAPRPPTTVEADMSDIRDHLDDALAGLPVQERTAVQLHLLAGHTLAEVAAHTGAPVSTVHVRVKRGLDRLRTTLGGRGASLAPLALFSLLMAEARAAVPSPVLVRLRASTAAGGARGATGAVSARVLRWSRQGLTLMQKLLLTSVVVAAASVAVLSWSSAEDAPAGSPPLVADGATTATTPEPLKESPVVLHWTDGARSARRLAAMPELELLTSQQRRALLDGIASVRMASIATRWVEGDGGVLNGWVQADGPQAPSLRVARSLIASALAPASAAQPDSGVAGLSISRDADGAMVRFGDLSSRLAIVDDRIVLHGGPSADLAEEPAPSATIDEDLVVLKLVRQADGSTREQTRAAVSISAGVRLWQRGRWDAHPDTAEHPTRFGRLRTVPAERFASLPADTIIAAIAAMTPETTRTSRILDLLDVPVSPLPADTTAEPGATPRRGALNLTLSSTGPAVEVIAYEEATRLRYLRIKSVLGQVDGHIVTWVQPGVPVPVWSLVADLPEAGYRELLEVISLSAEADGVVRSGVLSLTWQAGRLVVTTHPQGPTAVVESGGFTGHREVQQALAQMPREGAQIQAILRPTALMQQAHAFAPMILSQEHQERFGVYHRRVEEESTVAFLSIGADGQGFHFDASGMLALVAGMMIGQQLIDPHLLLQAIN